MGPEALLTVFRTTPTPSLLLLAHSHQFLVFEVNDAFLAHSFQSRQEIIGKPVFDVLPPLDREGSNQHVLTESLHATLERRIPQQMPVDRYQVPRAEGRGYSLRYFAPKNIPVIAPEGEVSFILHTLEEVNFRAKGQSALGFSDEQLEALNYKSLFDQNPDAVFSMDRFGYFTTVNKAATELVGFEAQELVRMHFSQLIEPSEFERLQKHLKDCLNGHPSSFEVGAFHRDNSNLRVAVTIMPVVIDGEIIGIYGIVKDITMAYTLQREKEMITAITNFLSSDNPLDRCLRSVLAEICSFTDTEGGELWFPSIDDQDLHLAVSYKKTGEMKVVETLFTKGYRSMIGTTWSKKETTGLNRLQSCPGYLRGNFARQNGFNSAISFPIMIKEDTVAVLALYSPEPEITPGKLSQGVLNHLGTHIQKKKAEQELHQYFRVSPDMICFIGSDGFFKKVNPAFTTVLGYSEDELRSRPFLEFIHPADRWATSEAAEKIPFRSKGKGFENRYICKNGQTKWLAWTSTYLEQERLILGMARDITDQKTLEQNLSVQQKHFANMFKEAPMSIGVLKGKDHILVSANSLYYKLTCRTPEIIGKSAREVFPELAPQGYLDWLDQVFATGKTISRRETLLQIDYDGKGNLRDYYINFIYQPYFNYDGDVEGIFYFGVDVTDEVIARQKIQYRKRQYIELIQNLPVAIYTTNTAGAIQLYNKAAVALWGCEPVEESIGWNPAVELLTTNHLPLSYSDSPMMKTLENGSKEPFAELVIKTADGHYRAVMAYTLQSHDSDNRLTGSINVMIDITERKKAEEELRKLSMIATSTDNFVVITGTNGLIDWVNDAFCSFFGVSREEILGKKPSHIFYERNPYYRTIPGNSAVPFMEEKSMMDRSFEGELEYYHPLKGSLWIELRGHPLLDAEGTVTHYFVIGADTTEKKRSFEKLEKSKNEVSSFAGQLNNVLEEERARIAREFHDEFGQQLTGLKMSLSSLRRRPFTGVEQIEQVVEPLLSDVDDIIQHIRRFATDLRPAILDTLGLVPSIEWLVKDFQRKTGIAIDLNLNVQDDLRLDRNLSICCFRICQEALTNVAKHSGATHVCVEVNQTEKLNLKITDNGKGILHEKINDPFSMGLLGMRERAHLVGGELVISSNGSSSTTVGFSVKLFPSINLFT